MLERRGRRQAAGPFPKRRAASSGPGQARSSRIATKRSGRRAEPAAGSYWSPRSAASRTARPPPWGRSPACGRPRRSRRGLQALLAPGCPAARRSPPRPCVRRQAELLARLGRELGRAHAEPGRVALPRLLGRSGRHLILARHLADLDLEGLLLAVAPDHDLGLGARPRSRRRRGSARATRRSACRRSDRMTSPCLKPASRPGCPAVTSATRAPLRLVEAEALGRSSSQRLDLHAEPAALDLAVVLAGGRRLLGEVRREWRSRCRRCRRSARRSRC